MSQYQSDPITQRLDRLERENWYWKRATLLLLMVIGAVILMGQATKPSLIEAQRVKAQSIEIIDDKGETRGNLSYNKYVDGGGVELVLASKTTATRAALVVNDNRASLTLKSRQKYTPSDEQKDRENTKKLYVELTDEELNRTLRDSKRLNGTQVTLTAIHSDKETRASWAGVSVYADKASIDVEDYKGTKAVLGYMDLKSQTTGVSETRPASSLVLFNKDKVFWKTP